MTSPAHPQNDAPRPQWLARSEESLPAGTRWLSAAETARAAALAYPKRRTEYLLRRLTVKHAVAAITGHPAEPAGLAGIEVPNAPGGAPYVLIDGGPAAFDVSVTDRAGWSVCVVGRRVGCDLELVEPRSPAFLTEFLTEAEQAFVAAQAAGDARDAAANLIWSAKESALKVLRQGLRRDTRSLGVTAGAAGCHGWGPLAVRDATGPPMTGWWRRQGVFLVTVVTAAPSRHPVTLDGPDPPILTMPRHSWIDHPSPR